MGLGSENYHPSCAPCPMQWNVTSVFASLLRLVSLAHFPGQFPGYLCFLLLLQYSVMGRSWKNYLLLMVTVRTIARVHTAPWVTVDILSISTHVCLKTSPSLATPSLGFHPLTFSLSLIKLLIDTSPARLLHLCQMPSHTEEYCANTITSWVLTVWL